MEQSHTELVHSLKKEIDQLKSSSKQDDQDHLDREKALVKMVEDNDNLRTMIKKCKRDKDECKSNSQVSYPRKYKKLAIIMPFTKKHTLRTRENLMKWGELFPCDAGKSYAPYIDFILYYNRELGPTLEEHQRVIDDLKIVLVTNFD